MTVTPASPVGLDTLVVTVPVTATFRLTASEPLRETSDEPKLVFSGREGTGTGTLPGAGLTRTTQAGGPQEATFELTRAFTSADSVFVSYAVSVVGHDLAGNARADLPVPRRVALNRPPVVIVPALLAARQDVRVTLEGSGVTEVDAYAPERVAWRWHFLSVPPESLVTAGSFTYGSGVLLSSSYQPKDDSFTPDLPGDYVLGLEADDRIGGVGRHPRRVAQPVAPSHRGCLPAGAKPSRSLGRRLRRDTRGLSTGGDPAVTSTAGYLLMVPRDPRRLALEGQPWPAAVPELVLHRGLNLVAFPTGVPAGATAATLATTAGATFVLRTWAPPGERTRFDAYLPNVSSHAFTLETSRGYLLFAPEARRVRLGR